MKKSILLVFALILVSNTQATGLGRLIAASRAFVRALNPNKKIKFPKKIEQKSRGAKVVGLGLAGAVIGGGYTHMKVYRPINEGANSSAAPIFYAAAVGSGSLVGGLLGVIAGLA